MNTVIQVVQHLRPGGIETLSLDLCSFAQKNEKILIVSLEGDIKTALREWPRLAQFKDNLIFMNKQPGLTLSLVAKLARLFKQQQAQAVHTHHIGPLLYAGSAARIAGVKQLIHTEHDAWHLNEEKRCKLQRRAIKLLKPILVADAQTVANNMQQQLKCSAPITVIRNGIDSEHFIPGNKFFARAEFGLPSDVQVIGCSGRMEAVKGHAVLIKALQSLPVTVHLALAGSGSLEADLRQLAIKLGLYERIHFLGHIDDMPSFYQALDLFCLPSLNEGLPLSPLEAQACNIVTLVTDVGGSKETLCPKTGKYTPANDEQLMGKTLSKMLRNTSDVKPRAYVQQHGDVRIMAKSYANLRRPLGELS